MTTADGRSMGLFEHLVELRQRAFRAIGAWLISTILASFFADTLISWLVSPLRGSSVIVLSPVEAPVVYFKVALAAGFGLALPFILYQLYMFVEPGLYPNERKIVLTGIPAAMGFFILGGIFTLQVMVPLSLPMLLGFLGEVVEPTYSLESYLSFVTTLVVWMGIIFETPLIIYIIVRVGLLTRKQLAQARRMVWFMAAVIAAVVTPTHDPITMMLATGPFALLYEIGLILARLGMRQRKRAAELREQAA
jgi:sec-independent protein translocase protein TatC